MKARRRRTTCSMLRMWKQAGTNTKRCGRSDRATQSSALMSLRVCETFFLQRTLLLSVVFMDNSSCCLSNATSSKTLEHSFAYYKQPNTETPLILKLILNCKNTLFVHFEQTWPYRATFWCCVCLMIWFMIHDFVKSWWCQLSVPCF